MTVLTDDAIPPAPGTDVGFCWIIPGTNGPGRVIPRVPESDPADDPAESDKPAGNGPPSSRAAVASSPSLDGECADNTAIRVTLRPSMSKTGENATAQVLRCLPDVGFCWIIPGTNGPGRVIPRVPEPDPTDD